MLTSWRLWWRVKDPVIWAERTVGREKTYETIINTEKVFGTIRIFVLLFAICYWIGRQNIFAFVFVLIPWSWDVFYGFLAPLNYLKAMRALVVDRKRLLERISYLESGAGASDATG